MTCIVGIKNGNSVYVGGDTLGVDSMLGVELRLDTKVFKNGPYVIGFTTSFRMGQVLRYKLELPVPDEDEWDIDRFMATKFIDAIRETAEEAGYLRRDARGQEELGSFIVGYKDRLYFIDDDMQIGVPAAGYTSVGCGHDLAKGALYALQNSITHVNDTPEYKIETALKAAETFSGGVRGPWTIMST